MADDCMRNATLLKCPLRQWWGKRKSDAVSISGSRSPWKVKQFFLLVGSIVTRCFNEIGWLLSQRSRRQTDIQTHRHTNKQH